MGNIKKKRFLRQFPCCDLKNWFWYWLYEISLNTQLNKSVAGYLFQLRTLMSLFQSPWLIQHEVLSWTYLVWSCPWASVWFSFVSPVLEQLLSPCSCERVLLTNTLGLMFWRLARTIISFVPLSGLFCQGGKQAPKIRTSLSALLFTRLTRFLPLGLLTGWNEWSPLWFHWLTHYISARLLHQFWWSLWGSSSHFKHCPCISLFSVFLLTILIHS